jgi:hypothetical protein
MSYTPLLLAFVVTLSLLGGGVSSVSGVAQPHGGGSPAGALDADRVGDGVRAQTDDASASVPERVTVTRGDEATIAVAHSDAANLTIGGSDYGFEVSVELGGSGTTEVVIDTRQTTASDPSVFVEGGSATLHSDPIDEPVEPGEYLLRVDIDGVERDIGKLVVEPRGAVVAEPNRLPGSFEPAEYVGDGADGDANVGPLTETMTAGSTVARGDYAVVRIEESGLETALNTTDLTGSDAANGLKLNFTQTDPGPNHEPREYVATDTADVSVLPALKDDVIYVLWNTSGIDVERIDDRNRYRASVALTEESGFVDSDTTLASTTFTLQHRSVSLSPEEATHYPWDNDTFTVDGTTNRAPNTELEVRLRSVDPDPFLVIEKTTVREDGSFEAGLDLADVPRGTDATLWVRGHFAQTKGTVRLVPPDPRVRFQDQTAEGTTLEVTSAELPEGGFVRLVDESGQVVGRSDYLDPGQHTAITAELGTALFETQVLHAELVRAAEDGTYSPDAAAYMRADVAVNDSALIDFPPEPTETPAPNASGTTTPTATATPTATETPYPVATRTPLAPSGATESSLPLSPAVAIVAVLAAAALFARRRGGDSP